MSAALGRLRAYFNDPLLVQVGKRMIPTSFAGTLAPILADIVGGVETLVATAPGFDPMQSTRAFRIAASDYISLVLLGPLMRHLRDRAPSIRIDVIAPADDAIQLLDHGDIDLIITPEGFVSPHHPAQLLFEERHVVVGWEGNPVFAATLTEEAFLSQGQVAVFVGRRREAVFAEREMDRLGLHRRIEIRAASFLAVPWLLPHTLRLTLMHERLAKAMLPLLPLQMSPPPFVLPAMREMLQYHRTREMDAGIQWLAAQLALFASASTM